MKHLKTTACLMAGMLILAGATGCNRSNVQPGSSQEYGRSYVREAPEDTEEKKIEEQKKTETENRMGRSQQPIEKQTQKTSIEETKKHDGLTSKETTKKESTKEGAAQPGRT